MNLLLYAVLFCVPFVCASLPSLYDTSIHTLDSSSCSPCRTLWDILSSCGLTLFACTWTAVHPDIPVDVGIVRITVHRLLLMVAVLFVPEVMIIWAVSQFLNARRVTKDFNAQLPWAQAHDRWTLTNGFFACMNGFVLYVDGEPYSILEFEELVRFVSEGSVEMPSIITEAEIKERSKGDGLSKCVAILQLV
ncbi:hypothetical protein P692DRAFT_20909766 [Suillus brevipes Sb2]|nr:hypothetical protein P692DRAFT_20909766 [Suillus brevipes Sb2]